MSNVPYASSANAGRPSRSAFSTESLTSTKTGSGSVTRVSAIPAAATSALKAYIRRRTADSPAQKPALLSLRLSSPSFLDSTVYDDLSPNPLYTIETQGTSTTLTRHDPWNDSMRISELRWPKILSEDKGREKEEVIVQMKGGRWKLGSNVLSPPMPNAPRKFYIPGYSRSLKWKKVGNAYWCVATSVSGPIAILDPAVASVPPRLKVFETLHDKYDSRPMLVHHGVSILLLDYLMVTSLLLVTDIQEWMVVKKYEGDDRDNLAAVPHTAPLTSSSQWRKIMLGEPLFPRRPSSSLSGGTSSLVSPLSSGTSPNDTVPPTPTSAIQMAKIIRGEPIHPGLRPEINYRKGSDSGSSDDDYEEESEESEEDETGIGSTLRKRDPSRPASPAAESICYPLRNGAAPNHTYLDPMFYGDASIPPVPPIPHQFVSQSLPSSPGLARSRSVRSLPRPPIQTTSLSPATPETSTPSSPLSSYSLFRSPSGRRLPVPPSPHSALSSPSLHRSPSSHQALNVKAASLRPGRSLPPTPISPSAPTSFVQEAQKSHAQMIAWTKRTTTDASGRVSVFEVPPPAYTSINFARGTEVIVRPPPVPPIPPHLR